MTASRDRLDDSSPASGDRSAVVELRQYTLRAGARETLIALFDSTFIESQEAVGIEVLGQFRDLDDPARFVWLRGFDDMRERARRLSAFYGGAVWRANGDEANATMIDSDDVLLLRPVDTGAAFDVRTAQRPLLGEQAGERGFVTAGILSFETPAAEPQVVAFFESAIAESIRAGGGAVLGYLVTEPSENTFPALPVREDEHVLVWLAAVANERLLNAIVDSDSAVRRVAANAPALARPPQLLRLEPTARSLLHGQSPPCRNFALDSRSSRVEGAS